MKSKPFLPPHFFHIHNYCLCYFVTFTHTVNYTQNERFIVELKDISLADKEAIQKIGAQGIVEIDNQLKIILGENAKQIKKYINELSD